MLAVCQRNMRWAGSPLALINAGLAQGKRRSGLAWWVVSLFLGPLATLLIVLLDPVKP